MAISYEEALATLEAMFGHPWTRETLDAVLRHEKGHMENTCERILNHGSQDPKLLVERLKAGVPDNQMAMDEELARQLQAQQRRGRNTSRPQPDPVPQKKGRGTPTQLPADFLRIPGYKHRSMTTSRRATNGGSAAAANVGEMDDETLARMLQDELFSEELARNPDFAHLARGGRSNGRARGAQPPGQRRAASNHAGAGGAGAPNPFEGVNVVENLSSTCPEISDISVTILRFQTTC